MLCGYTTLYFSLKYGGKQAPPPYPSATERPVLHTGRRDCLLYSYLAISLVVYKNETTVVFVIASSLIASSLITYSNNKFVSVSHLVFIFSTSSRQRPPKHEDDKLLPMFVPLKSEQCKHFKYPMVYLQ